MAVVVVGVVGEVGEVGVDVVVVASQGKTANLRFCTKLAISASQVPRCFFASIL